VPTAAKVGAMDLELEFELLQLELDVALDDHDELVQVV
jgi:hypothetical protein